MADLTGTMLNEYYLFKRMALGEVADVYCASSSRFEGREVAVKVFRSAYARHSVARRYFLSESRKISSLQHQHILPLLAYGEEADYLYAVSPLMMTGSLENVLTSGGPRSSVWQILPILRQLCEAVQYAHEHEVLHGNLKPSNIFIARDGRMLLADFGLACDYDEARQSLTRLGWGAAAYAAPEQALGVLRRASDIYALGVLLFRLLTGTLPFEGLSPEEVLSKHVHQPPPHLSEYDPSLPLSIDYVVQRALKKHAEERFASAREFSMCLQDAVSSTRLFPSFAPSPAPRLPEPAVNVLPGPEFATTRPVVFEAVPPSEDASLLSSSLEAECAFPEQGMVQALPVMKKPTEETLSPHSWRERQRQETDLFLSANPTEWSPLLMALSSLKQDVPGIESSSINFVHSGEDVARTQKKEATASQGGQWLSLLVLLLLLLGLLGALLSAFYFPHG